MVGLLIFDLDGTLIDSVPDLATAVNGMLVELGHESVDESMVRAWVGHGSYKLVERALLSVSGESQLLQNQVIMAETVFLRHYASSYAVKTLPYAGVDIGLRRLLSAGFKLALVTNKPMRFVPDLLTLFGWEDLFSVVLGGDSLSAKKPDPLPLLTVCEQLGVYSANAVMIGDSKNDVLAGQRAGMRTVGLSYGYNYGEPIAMCQPTWVFDEFDRLVKYCLDGFMDMDC